MRILPAILISGLIAILFLTACDSKPEGITWQEFAISTGNPDYCSKASHPDVCLTGFTQATGDGSSCSKVKDSDMRKTCYAYDKGVRAEEIELGVEAEELETENRDCIYDSECPSVCKGNIAWKQGCNPRTGKCEKTFDTDCAQQKETFGPNSFSKTCSEGVCVRNQEAIEEKKQELEAEKEKLKEEMGAASTQRAQLIAAKDQANQNCLGGLSDATVILMNELATKTAGILAGGAGVVKDAGSRVVSWTTPVPDYINKGLDEMSKAGTTEQKLTLDQYIVLNCQLNDFFNQLLNESDAYIDELTQKARDLDAEYEELP